MASFEIHNNEMAIPTCVSCSLGGNLVTIGFTDDKLKLYDMRAKGENFDLVLEGGHTDIVRKVKISDDGMICYSVGSDNTLRVWDISTRKCIKIYKNERAMVSNSSKNLMTSLCNNEE